MNVLIFSEERDASTNDVVEWLSFLDHNVYRVNGEDVITNINLDINTDCIDLSFCVRGNEINLNEIDSVWFRRGEFIFSRKLPFLNNLDIKIQKAIAHNLHHEELETLEAFVNNYLYDKNCIGNASKSTLNKLLALKTAKEVGLQVPVSRISSEKEELLSFFKNQEENCITKGVQDILSFTVENKGYHYATTKIAKEDLEEMGDTFFPSLLQENISKKYELRIFYLKQKFYSMAIFSQFDEQTKIDFRNYNFEKPNRNVPFKLPKEIEEKLENFMQRMNLDCGSIDMIVTTDKEYVFLEVNPKGQYGMVSIPCGYNLNYRITQELTKEISV